MSQPVVCHNYCSILTKHIHIHIRIGTHTHTYMHTNQRKACTYRKIVRHTSNNSSQIDFADNRYPPGIIDFPVQVIPHKTWQKFKVLALLSSYCSLLHETAAWESFLYIKFMVYKNYYRVDIDTDPLVVNYKF